MSGGFPPGRNPNINLASACWRAAAGELRSHERSSCCVEANSTDRLYLSHRAGCRDRPRSLSHNSPTSGPLSPMFDRSNIRWNTTFDGAYFNRNGGDQALRQMRANERIDPARMSLWSAIGGRYFKRTGAFLVVRHSRFRVRVFVSSVAAVTIAWKGDRDHRDRRQ